MDFLKENGALANLTLGGKSGTFNRTARPTLRKPITQADVSGADCARG